MTIQCEVCHDRGGPRRQHSLEKGRVDKGFSKGLAFELILKDEEELNKLTGRGQCRTEAFLRLISGLIWFKYQTFRGNGRSEEVRQTI